MSLSPTAAQANDDLLPTTSAVEAHTGSMFVSGARPAILWACVGAICIYYWGTFAVGIGLWAALSLKSGAMLPRPDLGIGDILGLLAPLLGIGTLRTVEKIAGVETRQIVSRK